MELSWVFLFYASLLVFCLIGALLSRHPKVIQITGLLIFYWIMARYLNNQSIYGSPFIYFAFDFVTFWTLYILRKDVGPTKTQRWTRIILILNAFMLPSHFLHDYIGARNYVLWGNICFGLIILVTSYAGWTRAARRILTDWRFKKYQKK